MNNSIMYGVAVFLLILSYSKDKNKTKKALKKALKTFENILPQFLGVITLIGILLGIFEPETITRLVGQESGFVGVILSAAVGAVTLIPGFVAFPLASLLLKNGAGYTQIAAFISTLMMVGVVTAPVEIEYFGKRITALRNTLTFIFSFLVAYIIGRVI